MKFTVFVTNLNKNGTTEVVATASNGGIPGGGPSVTWALPSEEVSKCFIGKRYSLEVTPD